MKNYVNLQRIETLITIRSHIAWTWLRKLGYIYQDLHKNVFVDGHKQPDVVEDCANFLKRIEELKPYIVEYNQDRVIKPKMYPSNCAVGGKDH